MDVTISSTPFADVFLACDRIAKPGGALNSTQSPLTGAKVNYGDLCAKMLAYSFLLLREEGALDISVAEKKVLFVKTRSTALHRKNQTTAHGAPLPNLLACVQDGKSAKDAVWTLIGEEMLTPWGFIASMAVQQAQELGFVNEKKGGLAGAFGKFATGIPKLEIANEKMPEITQRVDGCAQRWDAFVKADPELVDQLVKDCYNGIQSRQQSQSGSVD